MRFFTIQDKLYGFCRSDKGQNGDKFNRAVKLARMYDKLSKKFDGMIIRGQYTSDMARCALAIRIMMETGIRIGNESSAEGYMTIPRKNSKEESVFVQTYGLTTLKREHLKSVARKIKLMFLGKSHQDNYYEIRGELVSIIREYLKRYDGDTLLDVSDYELTKFIKKYVGSQFTPKDFRTLRANMRVYEKYEEISEREIPGTKKAYKEEVREIAEYVSEGLCNTPSVCKKSYIDGDFWVLFEEERLNK